MDEPTTGLDPVSRKAVWALINRMKQSRAVFLTTHLMDEADFLSDRVSIIAHGKIRCVGSTLHLKNKYGLGYHLSVVSQPGEA